jgi:hypothetical protein
VSVMVSSKCLPTLYLSSTRPSFTPIAAAPGKCPAGDAVADLLEFERRLQERLALRIWPLFKAVIYCRGVVQTWG